MKRLLGGSYDIYVTLRDCFANKYTLISRMETRGRGGDVFIVRDDSYNEFILKATKSIKEYEITKKANSCSY